MDSISTELKQRLLPQANALVAQAVGETGKPLVVEALLEACNILEASSLSGLR